MLIHHLPCGDTIHHYKKAIVIMFAQERDVISTGPNNGGFRKDLVAVFNHDDNPGPGMSCVMRDDTYEGHMNVIASTDLGLPPEKCTGLCTAAGMRNASIKELSYRDLTVTAIVTAGIEHNGGRAGDPATFCEADGSFYELGKEESADLEPFGSETLDLEAFDFKSHGLKTSDIGRSGVEVSGVEAFSVEAPGVDSSKGKPPVGTINIILHINAALDHGTLARTLITATEAKTAALQELMVRSHYSDGLATGSGTDGIISICNPGSSLRLTNAGKNSKVGELIGKTVKEAVKEALLKQTGLCPAKQQDILRIMGRFGIDEDRLYADYLAGPDGSSPTLGKADFIDRLDHLKNTSKIVETSFLYSHVMDLLSWHLISKEKANHMTTTLTGIPEEEGHLNDTTVDLSACKDILVQKYIEYVLRNLNIQY